MRETGAVKSPDWAYHPEIAPHLTENLCSGLGLHPLMAAILIRRGVDTVEAARRFLSPSLENLHDPFLLLGLKEGVDCIVQALEEDLKIVISGDYDVDGITSSALLADFLIRAGGGKIETFIPSRFEHGYGITAKTVDALLEMQPGLVITVDNGITAIAEIARLQEAGVTTVITDHHLPREEGLPPGIVINPRQPGCPYPFKEISGCGVTFKLITALRKVLRDKGWWGENRPEPNLKDYLDLVAIGTVADIVPLVDENRILVQQGLSVLNRGVNRPGLAALLALCRIRDKVDERAIAFQIAPRINAVGRMDKGALGVELLLAKEAGQAEELALRMDRENQNRRKKEEEMMSDAVSIVDSEGLAEAGGIVVASPDFHEGIIGIIASRLAGKHQKPVVVLAENDSGYKGSARSVPHVNVTEAFVACADLLEDYGGHSGAAGCRLSRENMAAFRERFAAACERLAAEGGPNPIFLDGKLEPGKFDPALVEQITSLAPFGQQNQEPSFLLEGSSLSQPPQILAGKHLKWVLEPGTEILAWNQAGKIESASSLDFRVRLGFNDYRGRRTIQLTVEDFREKPVSEL